MFQAPKLTDAGKNLYYRNMAGEGITFTTIQLGNGTISGPISAMTALVSAVVTIEATVKNNAEQYADVSGHFSNAELSEGFYWREIGVFAADSDYPNDRSHDILYCYQNAYDTADFIPVASVETVEKNITVPIIVGDASTVSCTLAKSLIMVTEADLEEHNTSADAHAAKFEAVNTEIGKKQDTITAKGLLKGIEDGDGSPKVVVASAGVDYQAATQNLAESDAMALTDTVPFFSGSLGQNRKVTLKALKEALGVESASINVTTCAGAVVVVTNGETTLNGVGSTKFSLPENNGAWEVSATLGGQTATTEVEVTGAMQYNVDLMITSSVAITHAPTKTAYNVGEAFDPTGLVVTATFADSTTEDVTDSCTYSPTVMTASTTAVLITYQRAGVTKTCTQEVTVLELSGISVTTAPTKTAYKYGETFNSAGMAITATYNDGATRVVSGWTCSPTGALGLSNTAITVSYSEGGVTKTCTQAITVSNYLSSIAVTTPPTKTAYFTGETFSSAGMVVTATMADGSTKAVTGYTCSPTAVAASTTAITVSYTEGGVTKTTTTPVTVTSISNTLASNSWATIRAVSDAGKGTNYWSVGDTKGITINGKVGATTFSNLSVSVFIIGFNHNSTREGTNRIHFQIGKIGSTLVGLVDSNYSNSTSTSGAFTMNTSYTNSGGWSGSHMRKTVLGSNSPTANTLLAALPSDLRAVMKSATKYSDNTGGGSNTASYVTSTTDFLPLLSEYEYHGARSYANSAEQNYQAQYDYYKAGNSKVHYKHNATTTAALAWCRSVNASYSSIFCLVGTDGSANYSTAYNSWALAPALFV